MTDKIRGGGRGDMMALLFLELSTFDWFFSMLAFRKGVQEGNPFLGWCLSQSIFTPVKFSLTIAVSVLILHLYNRRPGRIVTYAGIVLMALVNAYHIAGLEGLLIHI